jgi:hypothetical protein
VLPAFYQPQLQDFLTQVQKNPWLQAFREVSEYFHEHLAMHTVCVAHFTNG